MNCRIFQQRDRASDDTLRVRTDQPHRSGFNRLRPLGHVTHHKDGLTQRWRFLLDAARIRNDKVRTIHQVNKGKVVNRLHQMHARAAGEDAANGLANIRVEMHGIYDLDVGTPSNLGDCPANALEAVAKTLASMASYQDELAVRVEKIVRTADPFLELDVATKATDGVEQRIDDRIARDDNASIPSPSA
jgi:hypothetical protein